MLCKKKQQQQQQQQSKQTKKHLEQPTFYVKYPD